MKIEILPGYPKWLNYKCPLLKKEGYSCLNRFRKDKDLHPLTEHSNVYFALLVTEIHYQDPDPEIGFPDK